jgi:invasion protein IalB
MISSLGVSTQKTILAAFLFGVLMLVTLPLGAQPVQGQKFGNWTVKCEIPTGTTTQKCHIIQYVTVKNKTGRMLRIKMAIGKFGKEGKPGAILTLPLGFFLPPGVMLDIPGTKPIRMFFTICLPNGCKAVAGLSDDIITAMRTPGRGKVTLQDMRRNSIILPISLEGFSAAYDAVRKK